jgi:hypothetical protein
VLTNAASTELGSRKQSQKFRDRQSDIPAAGSRYYSCASALLDIGRASIACRSRNFNFNVGYFGQINLKIRKSNKATYFAKFAD